MADAEGFPPGASFGVQPPPPLPPAPQVDVRVTAPAGPTITPVPAQFRAGLSDRLRKRKPHEELVDVGDGDWVLVRGMDVNEADDMAAESADDEEGADGGRKSLRKTSPSMLRRMCYDPATREKLFTEWTDEELNALPMDFANKVMQGINKVMGLDGAPGKGLPSTGDAGSSSS